MAAAALRALASGARDVLGTSLSESQRESFDKYLKLLRKWQRVQRLVGSDDPAWIVEHLFLDSLLFLKVLPQNLRSLADVGSGAGFPGLPIKIVRPDVGVTLIEARARRVSFLSQVVRELALDGVRVVNERVERLVCAEARAYDAVVMRCAGDLAALLERVAGLVRPGGLVVASGPPSRRDLPRGEWIEVPGLSRGSQRRFAVLRVQDL